MNQLAGQATAMRQLGLDYQDVQPQRRERRSRGRARHAPTGYENVDIHLIQRMCFHRHSELPITSSRIEKSERYWSAIAWIFGAIGPRLRECLQHTIGD